MSLLDEEATLNYSDSIFNQMRMCQDWFERHMPEDIKGKTLFVSSTEYECYEHIMRHEYGTISPSEIEHIRSQFQLNCKIVVIDSYSLNPDGHTERISKLLNLKVPRMYLHYDQGEIRLELLCDIYTSSNLCIILENVEDTPDIITKLLLPYSSSPYSFSHIESWVDEELAKAKWAYRKGNVLYNFTNPGLMAPHRCVYVNVTP